MSVFTGLLLDISGTMGVGSDETWTQSLLAVAFDLVRYDISNDNRVFAVGVGSKNEAETIDMVGTLQKWQIKGKEISVDLSDVPASKETVDGIYVTLESKGARTIRQWADSFVIESSVSEYVAQLISWKLNTDDVFANKFVHEDLPLACRSWDVVPAGRCCQCLFAKAVSPFRKATNEDIHEVILKALLKDVDDKSVYSVQDAATILMSYMNQDGYTSSKMRKLLKAMGPFIYGRTPLYSALQATSTLIMRAVRTYPHHQRLLFILSDGFPSDEGDLQNVLAQLRRSEVTVVCCYITDYSFVESRRLYSSVESNWENGAKFLFKMSSMIPTNFIPRAIFLKYGWNIDITNNETRLFLHINHPDHVRDVCILVQNAVCCQDSLSDLLVSVSLDIYINQKNRSVRAPEQVGGTCYANASATVLHLAMHQIVGRDGGYPEFEKLKEELITRHGVEGANTLRVLQEVCPLYRLHCEEVDIDGALEAIAGKRPVVAKFRLSDYEWDIFCRFFERNPTGILTKRELDITRRHPEARCSGHAVVFTSYDSACLRLMNSWGEYWSDLGFFRIENASVLDLKFIDVFWTTNDLSENEKDKYRKHGAEVAKGILKTYNAFQKGTYTCPSCMKTSYVTEFRGTLSYARCPKCREEFEAKDGNGNLLALNMYLTSLSRYH